MNIDQTNATYRELQRECGMCGRPALSTGKLTADFGPLCPPCANRYRRAQQDSANWRDESGMIRAQTAEKVIHAQKLLKECCVAAEHIDSYGLEGELMVVLAGLENISGSPRRRNGARQFPTDDKNG